MKEGDDEYTLYDTLDILLFMLHIFTLALVGFID